MSPEVPHPSLTPLVISLHQKGQLYLFFLKLKIFYKVSLLPVLTFSCFFSTHSHNHLLKTPIRSLSPPGLPSPLDTIQTPHLAPPVRPACLSIHGLSLFLGSSRCSCHRPSNVFLPQGLHTSRLLYPLPPGGAGSLCLFTQMSPPRRRLLEHRVWNASHVAFPIHTH